MDRRRFSLLAGVLGLAIALPGATAFSKNAYERVSGPHSAQNLSVYFLHGASAPGPVPLTLAEAIASGSATVFETGTVSRLSVENTGDKPVFVQAGDVVKGGRQDRVISVSLMLPPHSGRVPIGAFCVEQGRWRKRGTESSAKFHSASELLPLKSAKLAILLPAKEQAPVRRVRRARPVTAQHQVQTPTTRRPVSMTQQRIYPSRQRGDIPRDLTRQQKVWASVGSIQGKLARNLKADVYSRQSASSLQLTLENKKLAKARAALIASLSEKGRAGGDIIGFVFAINGKINSGDIYASNGLFRKMWPRLLAAAATEAIAERKDKAEVAAAPPVGKVEVFLKTASTGVSSVTRIDSQLEKETRVAKGKAVMLSTRRRDGFAIHRSFVAY